MPESPVTQAEAEAAVEAVWRLTHDRAETLRLVVKLGRFVRCPCGQCAMCGHAGRLTVGFAAIALQLETPEERSARLRLEFREQLRARLRGGA